MFSSFTVCTSLLWITTAHVRTCIYSTLDDENPNFFVGKLVPHPVLVQQAEESGNEFKPNLRLLKQDQPNITTQPPTCRPMLLSAHISQCHSLLPQCYSLRPTPLAVHPAAPTQPMVQTPMQQPAAPISQCYSLVARLSHCYSVPPTLSECYCLPPVPPAAPTQPMLQPATPN